jgi:hypothetical protein
MEVKTQPPVPQVILDEPDFTPQDLAKLKKLHVSRIIRMFRSEPGVLRISGSDPTRKRHFTLRIPAHVARKVFSDLTVGAR